MAFRNSNKKFNESMLYKGFGLICQNAELAVAYNY